MRRFALLACLAIALPVLAQQPPKLDPVPEPPPPPPGMQDDVDEPQVTITRRGEDRVEEYRIRGKLYMVKVTPPHGVPYYLVDQAGEGQFVRQDGPGNPMSVPMWVIKSW
ncbi:MAG: DUF2782 domain-containing protein [Zoogloeaceae bacterium]|nr:DUF2782 domain-containing protein [Zoogloeaceae bacterium]